MYDLEEKIVQIYLPDGQFYLPQAVGQWDMSSPGHVQKINGDHFNSLCMRLEWNFHRIWITMEHSLVEWAAP